MKIFDAFYRSYRYLNLCERRIYIRLITVQVILGFLDLGGILLSGSVAALAISGVESKPAHSHVDITVRFFHLQSLTFQQQVGILGLLAGALFLLKTVLSVFMTRMTLGFLSQKAANFSKELIEKTLYSKFTTLKKRSTQEYVYLLGDGLKNAIIHILGSAVTLLSDLVVISLTAACLIIVDPTTAIISVVIFGLLGTVVHMWTRSKMRALGLRNAELSISNNTKVIEVLNLYRESVIRNRRPYYAHMIGELRKSLADTWSQISFMPYINKYSMELAIVLGSVALGAAEVFSKDAVHATSMLTIFLVATSRLAPAALRVQQSTTVISMASASAELVDQYLQDVKSCLPPAKHDEEIRRDSNDFIGKIEIRECSYSYPENENFRIESLNLTIAPGSNVAIVGGSGSGKTTLVDLMLGILEPDSGSILISGKTPNEAARVWPGAMSYVPQEIFLTSGTVRENVEIGYPPRNESDEFVINVLQMAELNLATQNLTLDTPIGENGSNLSGGQRQRLGIARALYSNPTILILDEATSALDGETEASITETLRLLNGKVTVVVIAHRLSTVREADQIIYLEQGRILSIGTFDEVRASVPAFDRQATHMGL